MNSGENKFSQISPTSESPSYYFPFLWVAIAWALLGTILSTAMETQTILSIGWMLALWSLCVTDLFALAKTIAAVLILMSDQLPEKKPAAVVQAIVWGVIKFASFGAIGVVLWKAPDAPTVGLLSGVSTLIIVPLFGGLLWSQKELRHA